MRPKIRMLFHNVGADYKIPIGMTAGNLFATMIHISVVIVQSAFDWKTEERKL